MKSKLHYGNSLIGDLSGLSPPLAYASESGERGT